MEQGYYEDRSGEGYSGGYAEGGNQQDENGNSHGYKDQVQGMLLKSVVAEIM